MIHVLFLIPVDPMPFVQLEIRTRFALVLPDFQAFLEMEIQTLVMAVSAPLKNAPAVQIVPLDNRVFENCVCQIAQLMLNVL